MRVALLHAYSPKNSGDGLLVKSAMDLVKEACGERVSFDLFAARSRDFSQDSDLFGHIFATKPTLGGYSRSFLKAIFSLSEYDLVVAVGGGYFRFGSFSQAAKTWLVHMPQLLLASGLDQTPVVYLPQSCGPLGRFSKNLLRSRLSKVDLLFLRDDRSVCELRVPDSVRMPDCAILEMNRRGQVPFGEDCNVVIGTRELESRGMARVRRLAGILGPVDGLIQSTVGNNSDFRAVRELCPQTTLTQKDLAASCRGRVVVSTRLHGALMALAAGHYVIHLAYERKGYGAFQDLGMEDFVHSVFHFDPTNVALQVETLRKSPSAREHYDRRMDSAIREALERKTELVDAVRMRLMKGQE